MGIYITIYIFDKNKNIKVIFNISLFQYLKHKINKYTLGLIANYTEKVNIIIILF